MKKLVKLVKPQVCMKKLVKLVGPQVCGSSGPLLAAKLLISKVLHKNIQNYKIFAMNPD
jgi:hypothetical protein